MQFVYRPMQLVHEFSFLWDSCYNECERRQDPMGKKNTDSEEWSTCRYSVVQNVCYCIRNTVHCYGLLLCWCGMSVLINAVLPVVSAYLPKLVIEQITEGHSLWQLSAVVLGFMGSIALLSAGSQFFKKYLYHQKFRMNTYYLKQVALKGLTTDYANQEEERFRRLQAESFGCCNGNFSPLTNIYDILISICTSALGLLAFGTILVQVNGFLLLFLAATTLISFFLNQRVIRWMDQNSQERILYEQRLDYINEASGDLRSAKDIRLYRMASWFSDIYQENMNGTAGWYRRLSRKIFGVAVWDSGFAMLREGAAYAYFIWLVWQRQITVADFVLYFGAVAEFSSWLANMISQVSLLNQLNVRINYLRSYLEYPEHYRREQGIQPPQAAFPGTIELKNVSYRYEGSGQYALRDFSLKIMPGEHLAVVGLNGAGKTTLVKLLCGLIDPTEGQVLYDGIDVREYHRTEYYKLFSAVFQQFSILPVSIEEIVAGAPAEALDCGKVRQCLETAGLWDKVARLPQGVKSPFGKTIYDDGVEFSGGEVQKLLLARALYKSAPIMLLDEPTAALDSIAESHLYENYHRISEGRTTVFISHRLASTSFCSRIILMENGQICEEGTHDRLLEQKGKYERLFETQAKYYRETGGQTEVEPWTE